MKTLFKKRNMKIEFQIHTTFWILSKNKTLFKKRKSLLPNFLYIVKNQNSFEKNNPFKKRNIDKDFQLTFCNHC